MWLANRRGATPKDAVWSWRREARIAALTLVVYAVVLHGLGWLFARLLLAG